jgi:hypothetical protein
MATSLDPRKLTETQRRWVGRRGETLRVRTVGGRVMDTDVPTPLQRFKQFCYALDNGLLVVEAPPEPEPPKRRRRAKQEPEQNEPGSGQNEPGDGEGGGQGEDGG